MSTPTRRRPAALLVGVWIQLLLAVGFAAIRFANTPPPLRTVEWLGNLAMALVYALPALLALLALAGRPAALLAAAVLCVPLAFTALSGVSLLLLVPAALYAVAYLRWKRRPALALATIGLVAAVAVLGVAAFAALLAGPGSDDTLFCWSATTGPDGATTYGPVERRAQDPTGQHAFGLAEGSAGTTQEQGCSTGVLELPQAALSVAVVAVALACALLLPRQPLVPSRAPAG